VLMLLTVYSYALYPLLVRVWGKLGARRWKQASVTPSVTLIISVYNEADVIGAKIENALALEYPHDLLEILVASDGSSDLTHDIVRSFSDPRVGLLVASERKGKTACLNRAVPAARGEIVVFTDANAMFPSNVLRQAVRHFADPRIGLVTGWTKYAKEGASEGSAGLYARFERATKEAESQVSSCVGADGALFAMRKNLYVPLRDDDINDLVIPLDVIAHGRRVILDREVFCVEEPAEGEQREFRRQARITNRALVAIWRRPAFLNPLRYGSFAFFLASHKVLRFLVPFFFVASVGVALWKLGDGMVYTSWIVAAAAFLLAGMIGMLAAQPSRFLKLAGYLVLTLAAQLVGWFRWATGNVDVTWQPQR